MTQQEILEYNKLCAEFLGFKYRNSKKAWGKYPLNNNSFLSLKGWLSMDRLQFHSDWNWIMEVCEAIEQLDDNFYFVKINTGGCFIHPLNDTKDYKGICYQAGKTKKEAVVQAINQFLIWYNEQSKTLKNE